MENGTGDPGRKRGVRLHALAATLASGLLGPFGALGASAGTSWAVEMPQDAVGAVGATALDNGTHSVGFTAGLPVNGAGRSGGFEIVAGFWHWMSLVPSDVQDSELSSASTDVQSLGPNPFGIVTSLAFRVGGTKAAPSRVEVFDVSGRSVALLLEGELSPGDYVVNWDRRTRTGQRAPSGVYFARFQSGDYDKTIRLIAAD